jgi:hypothetical protein
MPAFLYLHGFASGPSGRKADHCRAWAEARGIPFLAPDLNLPSFEKLTISAQVEAVESLLATLPEPPVVVGSSLGGVVAAAVAHRGANFRKLILLAPGLGFARRRLFSARWAGYREHRRIPIFHHAYDRWVRLGAELLDDLPAWADDDTWQVRMPVVVIHGKKDEAVPVSESEEFLSRHPGGVLHLLDDDHSLLRPETLLVLDGELERAFSGE